MARTRDELDISVVVCTRNRAGPLETLLTSMAAMRRPEGVMWEVLIVDNGSTDGTPRVVAGFEGRLPIRYTREDRAGLSNARNHGVAEARGRYLCWTDDDATVDPDWLAAYAAAFERHPEAAVFGGRIVPSLEGPTPTWFARAATKWPLNGIVAERNFGDRPIPLDFGNDIVPWGVNFAVRAEELRRHAFDPNLGVSPEHRRSSEESQVMFEIVSGGASGWWVPDAKVTHHFPTSRQTRAYVLTHFAAIGESLAYLDHTRTTHVMNRDGRQPRLVRANPARLAVLIRLNAALAAIFHAAGLELRSLYHLRRQGLYAGVASFQRSVRA